LRVDSLPQVLVIHVLAALTSLALYEANVSSLPRGPGASGC